MSSPLLTPVSIDLSHHLSKSAKARPNSPLKDLLKYLNQPGLLVLAGGLPNPEYFPFASISGEALLPTSFPVQTKPSLLTRLGNLFPTFGGGSTTTITIPKYESDLQNLNLATGLQYNMARGLVQLQALTKEFSGRVYKPAYTDFITLLHAGNTDGWFKCIWTFCEAGDGIFVSEWTYVSAMVALRPVGVKPVSVSMDGQGMRSDNLREVLEGWNEEARGMKRPHLLYVVPVGQNPTGTTMGTKRKNEIYDICVEYDILIIEDDPYYFLQFDSYVPKDRRKARPDEHESLFLSKLVPSFLNFDFQGRVIRLDSFSKNIAPGCRLGWFTCNPTFAERLERLTEESTQAPCGFSELMVAKLLITWKFEGYMRWLKALGPQYTKRRDFLIDSISDEFQLTRVIETVRGKAGQEVYHARPKRPRNLSAEKGNEKERDVPMFSFIPPTSGMFLWITVHLESCSRPPADKDPLERQLFDRIARAGVLFAPGWVFSANADQTRGSNDTANFRVSFSTAEFNQMRKAISIFGREVELFLKEHSE